jgi:hypothetical protein
MQPVRGGSIGNLATLRERALTVLVVGIAVAVEFRMLKLLGSYALARLLGFGLFGAIIIYALLSLLT